MLCKSVCVRKGSYMCFFTCIVPYTSLPDGLCERLPPSIELAFPLSVSVLHMSEPIAGLTLLRHMLGKKTNYTILYLCW